MCQGTGKCAVKQDETDRVLLSAEGFFKALRSKNYVQTWSLLSSGSKETIIDDILKASRSNGKEYSKEQVGADLQAGGAIAVLYWKGFLSSFDPNSVLEESRWEMGDVREDKAELLITHKRSSHPARLQMFKEDGSWKVGLTETFWTRKK